MSATATATATATPTTASQMFVNLPVKDLQASIAFFKSLGFAFNPDFCGEDAACLIIGPNLFAMLLNHERFRHFAPRDIADTTKVCEALFALHVESREKVDDLVRRAVAAGGATHDEPTDHGFMYDHGFTDLDGHGWGVFHMSATPQKA